MAYYGAPTQEAPTILREPPPPSAPPPSAPPFGVPPPSTPPPSAQPPSAQPPSTPAPSAAPAGRKPSLISVLIAVIVVLVVGAGAGLGLVLSHHGSTPGAGEGGHGPVATVPATRHATTPPATPSPASPPAAQVTVPLSELQIAHTLFGVKYGGSTMTEVHFLGWPWMMNGMEVAELNAKFSDGTIWFLRFVYDPQNKDWSDYAPFQVSSFQSQRGLSQPFPANEATVAGAEGKAS